MHDIADLELRGVVGVFVASEQFVDAARVQGEALGFPAPLVVVPHPVQDRTDDELRAYADGALAALLRALTAGDQAGPDPSRPVDPPAGPGVHG